MLSGDPQSADAIVLFFVVVAGAIIVSLIIQSFQHEGQIKQVKEAHQRSQLLSQERSARAQAYSTALVLAGGAIGYYQFVYGEREKEAEKFEKATSIIYSAQSSPPARIRAMDSLLEWGRERGQEGENQIAKIITDGLRVWAQKTQVRSPCRNDRMFDAERIGTDTIRAIAILKGMKQRTVFLDFSNLTLQDADFSGEGEQDRVNLRFADFHGADLSGAKLNFTDLRGADFYCANLYAAELRGSIARRVEVELEAPPEIARKLQLPNFTTNFVQARMEWAKLQGGDFTGANLIEANMKHASVDAATQFAGADMRRAVLEKLMVEGRPVLQGANLERACVDEEVWAVLRAPDVDARVTAYSLAATPPECQAPRFGQD